MASKKATLKWQGERAIRKIKLGASRGVEQGARLIVREALHLILDTAKTGHIYSGHQASAPGEAPASEHGTLITSFRISLDAGGMRAFVTNEAPHAKKLEFGTVKMLPRPFMRPAAANVSKVLTQTVANSIIKETKGL